MPISDAIRVELMRGGRITPQSVADMALTEWQAMRAAAKRGDHASAAIHRAEFDAIAELFRQL